MNHRERRQPRQQCPVCRRSVYQPYLPTHITRYHKGARMSEKWIHVETTEREYDAREGANVIWSDDEEVIAIEFLGEEH